MSLGVYIHDLHGVFLGVFPHGEVVDGPAGIHIFPREEKERRLSPPFDEPVADGVQIGCQDRFFVGIACGEPFQEMRVGVSLQELVHEADASVREVHASEGEVRKLVSGHDPPEGVNVRVLLAGDRGAKKTGFQRAFSSYALTPDLNPMAPISNVLLRDQCLSRLRSLPHHVPD